MRTGSRGGLFELNHGKRCESVRPSLDHFVGAQWPGAAAILLDITGFASTA
jgi:hypothetical protein